MALLALRGVRAPQMERALAAARRSLSTRSADGQNWLRLGLSAHGQLPANYRPPEEVAYRTVTEVALNEIVNRGGLS